MPCPSNSYAGVRVDDRYWHNWLGNVSYVVPGYFQPSTRQQLVWILQQAEAQGKRVKAVGSGWSFEDCAVSEDWVVDLENLNKTITFLTASGTGRTYLTPEWAACQFGTSKEKLYHVEAGIRILELNKRLMAESLAMLTLGGSQGQTLAGAISTSTHGSDLDQPPLPGVIQAIHLVTTGGQEVWIESATEPVTANDAALLTQLGCPDLKIIRDDELLRAAMVTIGRFGVIYSYVIKVTSFFRLGEWTETLSWSSVADALTAGVGKGSNVAVRDHLGGVPGLLSDPPEGLRIDTAVADFRFLDILLSSNMKTGFRGDVCWVRRRWPTTNIAALNLEAGCNPICHPGVANAILVAAGAALGLYAANIAMIPIYGAIKAAQIGFDVSRLNVLAHDPGITGGEALTASLNAVWRAQMDHELEWLIAELNHIVLKKGLGDSMDRGRRGPGWQISSGSKERTDDECYRANSIEVIFSTATSGYIDFINRLLDNANRFRIGGYISIRFSSRCDGYLSMHNVDTPLAVSIEVASIHGLEGNDGWIAFTEKTAKEMGGRPHWGQQNQMSQLDLLNLYRYEELLTWWHQCFLIAGQSQTFSNSYTRQRGLEPSRRPATAFAMVSPATLDFGRVLENKAATRDRSLIVSNVGIGLLSIQDIRLTGTQAAAFSLTPHSPGPFPVALQQGEAFPISIRFQSAATGEHVARVEITSLDHRSGSQQNFHAVVLAHVVAPDMNVLPTTISFGFVQAEEEVQRNVLITNDGLAPLRFRVTRPEAWSFFQWTGDTPSHWRSLLPGEAEPITVHYKPSITGKHSSRIVIVSETQTVYLELLGERVPSPLPEIHAIPRQLSFGLVNVGASATLPITLVNDSAALLTINTVSIDGPDRGLFALPGPIPSIVHPGQAAILTVSFRPAALVAGGNHARILIESNASNDPELGVGLFGMGAAPNILSQWIEPVLHLMMR